MKQILTFKAMMLAMVLFPAIAQAGAFLKIQDISGESIKADNWFFADSFSFGVEREARDSGIGELQPVTIIKGIDQSTPLLARYSISGESIGDIEICVTNNPDAPTNCYLRYKLERCFIKSWSTSSTSDDRITEEVTFYYNKIAFSYPTVGDGGTVSWDKDTNQPWPTGELSLMDYR